eukprot:GHVU01058545.1.p1 GENE.GHVU01058545.1~~GHVU01058545.1.p1  ORF type:complete len:290 (-),score=29.25 GHVU01058545.1:35-877(-)
MSAPLAQVPSQNYLASQQQQTQQQQFNQHQQGQYRPQRGGRDGGQQQQPYGRGPQQQQQQQRGGRGAYGGGGNNPGSGPATHPNNANQQRRQGCVLHDQQGDQIGPCLRCNKPHRGRCWRCRDCNNATDCPCSLPKLCMRCGHVTHDTEQCARQIGQCEGPAGNVRITSTSGTPMSDGITLQFRPDTSLPLAELNRIRDQLAAVAESAVQMAGTPAASPPVLGTVAAPIPIDPTHAATGVPPPAPGAAWVSQALHTTQPPPGYRAAAAQPPANPPGPTTQ